MMTTVTIRAKQPAGGFEELYPQAPFSELIRLTLIAAEAIARLSRRDARRAAETAGPAMAS